MAESFSLERRKLMRYLGARVIVTPRAGKGTGMVVKAQELFESSANCEFHYNTTGLEILSDFEGAQLDYFVLGYGTGGTFVGAGRRLREHRPEVKICLAEPAEAPLLASGQKSERRADGSATGSHPFFAPHPIQGWTPDFIAKIVEDGVDGSPGYDEYMAVPGSAAVNMSQMLARTQGIFTGISGGASMHAAVELAKKAPEGSVLLVLLADTGERYFSTPLFANINESMNEEELVISRSTPSFQMYNAVATGKFNRYGKQKRHVLVRAGRERSRTPCSGAPTITEMCRHSAPSGEFFSCWEWLPTSPVPCSGAPTPSFASGLIVEDSRSFREFHSRWKCHAVRSDNETLRNALCIQGQELEEVRRLMHDMKMSASDESGTLLACGEAHVELLPDLPSS
ncbi:Cysteine synthase [Symbiodinium microadriaticum]|uniref:Cysteine synthase n=1 Tax=Symbiodinium microadriaticum TaxID=2951 RepID=A0A1Q9EQ01_SYMMI|nr:Cysteine synthase [Symbiodinium microadriaticum]